MPDFSRVPFTSPPVVWNNGRFDVALGVVPRSWLRPAPYNPRTMSHAARARLTRGAEEFGLVDTLVAADDGEVIGGHQRLVTEERRGSTEVPVLVVFGVDQAGRRMLNVLLNNPHAQGQWDLPTLTELLSELDANGVDATLTGFSEQELAKLLGEPAPDAADALDPGEDRYAEQYAVLVTCASEAEQKTTYERLVAEGYNCKVVVT